MATMATRSLTVFKQENGQEIVVMYRQFDGYPEGHGQELADYLAGSVIVNGIGGDEARKTHNGMGCLSASVVAHFKTRVGSFYLHPAWTRNRGEDYIYEVFGTVGTEPQVAVMQAGNEIFRGTASDLVRWLAEPRDGDE